VTVPTTFRSHLKRIVAVARVETLQIVRDRTSLSLILGVPALQLALFGFAVNPNPKNIPIAIAGDAKSGSPVARVVTDTGYFVVVADKLPPGGAARMVATGSALIGIELPPPPDLKDTNDNVQTRPIIVADAADPATVRPALGALETALWRYIALLSGPVRLAAPPSVDVIMLYNPEGRASWSITPGLAGVVVMISMLMMGALTLVRERERGTWEGLLATPVDALDALVGKLAPYVVLGVFQTAIVIYAGSMLFGLPVPLAFLWLLAASSLYAAANLILGFALSALAQNQIQAVQAAVLFYLPSMLLSGFMFPFQGMPAWAQALGNLLPLTHFVRAARGVLLKGQGLHLVLREMTPVAFFAVLATGLALFVYRRRLD
jgi:ABC-2 type transport system permease protein